MSKSNQVGIGDLQRHFCIPLQPQWDQGKVSGLLMVARAFRTEGMFISLQEPSLYTVKAILILDNDGDRLFAKVRFPFRLV